MKTTSLISKVPLIFMPFKPTEPAWHCLKSDFFPFFWIQWWHFFFFPFLSFFSRTVSTFVWTSQVVQLNAPTVTRLQEAKCCLEHKNCCLETSTTLVWSQTGFLGISSSCSQSSGFCLFLFELHPVFIPFLPDCGPLFFSFLETNAQTSFCFFSDVYG